jgi:hypothetical protein
MREISGSEDQMNPVRRARRVKIVDPEPRAMHRRAQHIAAQLAFGLDVIGEGPFAAISLGLPCASADAPTPNLGVAMFMAVPVQWIGFAWYRGRNPVSDSYLSCMARLSRAALKPRQLWADAHSTSSRAGIRAKPRRSKASGNVHTLHPPIRDNPMGDGKAMDNLSDRCLDCLIITIHCQIYQWIACGIILTRWQHPACDSVPSNNGNCGT